MKQSMLKAIAEKLPTRLREGLGEGLSLPSPHHPQTSNMPSPSPSRWREGNWLTIARRIGYPRCASPRWPQTQARVRGRAARAAARAQGGRRRDL